MFDHISIFDHNCIFLTQISMFDQHFHLWPQLYFLTQISIFDQHFHLWPQLYFLTQISIFDQNFVFWPSQIGKNFQCDFSNKEVGLTEIEKNDMTKVEGIIADLVEDHKHDLGVVMEDYSKRHESLINEKQFHCLASNKVSFLENWKHGTQRMGDTKGMERHTEFYIYFSGKFLENMRNFLRFFFRKFWILLIRLGKLEI